MRSAIPTGPGSHTPSAAIVQPRLDARTQVFKRRNPKIDGLQRIPLLEGCTQGELKTVAELSALRTYEPGTVLIEKDSPSGELLVIVDGSVDVTDDGALLATLDAGSVLGESAILDFWRPPKEQRSTYETGRRTATVTAGSDAPVEALVFEPAGYEKLRDAVPHLARQLANEVNRRFRPEDADTDDA